MARSQAIGAAGEHVAQAALLLRGWIAGNVNSGGMMNAPAIDLVAVKGARNVRLAVKSCSSKGNCIQWSAPPGWKSLFKGNERPDYVIFIWFWNKNNPDDWREFIVPANVVDRHVRKSHEFWHSKMKRNGEPRKLTNHVAIWWSGSNTRTSIARGFAEKWKQYEGAWDLLERKPRRKRQI